MPAHESGLTPATAAVVIDGLTVTGEWPRLLVWVKTGCRKHRKDFAHWCRKLAIGCETSDPDTGDMLPAQDYGHKAAYVLYGLPGSMVDLLGMEFIISSEAVMAYRVPQVFKADKFGHKPKLGKPSKPKDADKTEWHLDRGDCYDHPGRQLSPLAPE